MIFTGFGSSHFRSRCSVNNTITIIKTNSNSVFGGYVSIAWGWQTNNNGGDFNSFLFSIRRNGTEDIRTFKNGGSQDRSSTYNINNNPMYGPSFGFQANDLKIVSYSNRFASSTSNLGYTFQLPEECTYNSKGSAASHLLGVHKQYYRWW